MILVTDAHVCHTYENVTPFFEMLAALEASGEDVVFLGDIFDLWISLPRYEESIQLRFLDWCRRLSQQRMIGFVEGNHEFYMIRRHGDCFSWSSSWGHRLGTLLLVHGDLINRADTKYLRWRRFSKNAIMRTLIRFLPYGPDLVHKVKKGMSKTNQAYRLGLPVAALNQYAETCFGEGLDRVLVGHFHEAYHYESGQGRALDVLPDWLNGGWISRFDPVTGQLSSNTWQALLLGSS